MKEALPPPSKLSAYKHNELLPPKQSRIPSSLTIRPSRLKCIQPIAKDPEPSAFAKSRKRHIFESSSNTPTQVSKSSATKYLKIYFPAATLRAKRYRISKGYHVGPVLVSCSHHNKKIRLQCFDHGQFPWGRSRSKGAMARICKSLGISPSSGIRNTYLATHIFIGLLFKKIFTAEDLVSIFGKFMISLMSSNYKRDDTPTIKAIFRKLKLDGKICLRQVIHIPTEGFVLMSDFYGDLNKPTIYLMHKADHFFLGLE